MDVCNAQTKEPVKTDQAQQTKNRELETCMKTENLFEHKKQSEIKHNTQAQGTCSGCQLKHGS
jgi:hypothetical protein